MSEIRAPWTDEQVEGLNRYQRAGYFHEFSCGGKGDTCRRALVATTDGWRCPDPSCDYTQDWAHAFMSVPPACECPNGLHVSTYCRRYMWDRAVP